MNSKWVRLGVIIAVVGGLLVLMGVSGAAAVTWTHSVSDGYDVWYLNGTTQKFRYNLAHQQWGHYSTADSSWHTISATGRPNTFIGGGGWYDLGTIGGRSWQFQYSAGYDKGTFKFGTKERFLYRYALGQWYDTGDSSTPSWQVLGASGRAAAPSWGAEHGAT